MPEPLRKHFHFQVSCMTSTVVAHMHTRHANWGKEEVWGTSVDILQKLAALTVFYVPAKIKEEAWAQNAIRRFGRKNVDIVE